MAQPRFWSNRNCPRCGKEMKAESRRGDFLDYRLFCSACNIRVAGNYPVWGFPTAKIIYEETIQP